MIDFQKPKKNIGNLENSDLARLFFKKKLWILMK